VPCSWSSRWLSAGAVRASTACTGGAAECAPTNFTTLALVVPAAKEIASSDLDLAGRAVVIAVLVVLASTPVWLPLALRGVAPGPAVRGLIAISDLIGRRRRLLTVLVVAGLGLFLVVRGILRLLGV
jgi:hypothetical protein